MTAFSSNTALSAADTLVESVVTTPPVSAIAISPALVRAYGFVLGGYNFLLAPSIYSELIKDPRWAGLPNVEPHCAGVLNLRGNIVPLFQLTTFIDGSAPFSQAAYALLIGAPGHGAAILLEDKPQVFDYRQLEVSHDYGLAPVALAGCLQNTYRYAGSVWFELSHEALFLSMAS